MKKPYQILIGIAAIAMQACAPVRPAAEEASAYVYNFAPTRYVPSESPGTMIERFLGQRDVGDLHRSADNTLYYVSRQDVSETFQYDFNTGNLTFNKGRKRNAGSIPQLPDSARS